MPRNKLSTTRARGRLVGIDRYASPHINWLSCARRDATALYSLFTDTLGGSSLLVTDNVATRQHIAGAFEALWACSPDDVVVIAFSGHGTETHQLVTYDADIRNLEQTCIPLSTLTEWFSRIPARNLVCFLDCCFSGGMGAKALHIEAIPRGIASTASLLDQLSGDGRLIVTASLADEKAWESQRLGHGLLTFHLLKAQRGAEEVVQGGEDRCVRALGMPTPVACPNSTVS
jgi:uncharacterized caspase-like protein